MAPIETEIKLRVESEEAGRRRLLDAGYQLRRERVFEANVVFDTPGREMRARGELIRLRTAGDEIVLTYKGAPLPGPHKSRTELEVRVSDFEAMHRIIESLGFEPAFRYEKYRTEFEQPGAPGHATLDETPIGSFLELEGPSAWIDASATVLGFRSEDYITKSYGSLYLDHCRTAGIVPRHMIFTLDASRACDVAENPDR